MGLAASQARLLSITQRISDNELRAQLINNQKMRLSSESSQVSENYINALNKTNLVFSNYDADDKAQNVPLTFNNLTAFNQYNNQYGLTNTAGNILISESEAEIYKNSNGSLEEYLRNHGLEYTTSYWDTIEGQLTDSGMTFTSPQLKEMYEGNVANGIPSYEETIKTKDYTDFADYADKFSQMATAISQAEAKRNQLIGTYTQAALSAGQTFSKIDSLSLPVDATKLTQVNNALKADIGKYFDGFNYDANNTGKELEIPTSIIDNYDMAHGYIKADVASYFEDNKTTKYGSTSLTTGGYDSEALFVVVSGIQYARVPDPSGDGNLVYARLSGSNSGALPGNNWVYSYDTASGTMMQYKYDDIADDGSTSTITPEVSWEKKTDGTYVFSYEETDMDGNTYTALYRYPTSAPAADKPLQILQDVGMAEMLSQIKKDLKNATAAIFTKVGKELGGKIKDSEFVTSYSDGAGGTKTFTDDERKFLTQTASSNVELSIIIDNINTIAFGRTGVLNSDKEVTAFLNYIMSGSWDKGSSLKFTVPERPAREMTIPASDINPAFINVVNAYIVDTMMDIFGEPVYGYMKQEGGKWVVANEEAQWYMNLFEKIQSSGYQMLANGLASSTEWIQFALENGIVVMEQINSENNWQGISYTSCSDISEQNDSTAATIAEAEYNKAMRQIEAKDELFDLELKNIDTEHSSLQSEYESVKKAMTGNIERTFQMYS